MFVLMMVLFTIAHRQKTPTSPLLDGWIDKLGEHIEIFLWRKAVG